jgi:hypothetical protein
MEWQICPFEKRHDWHRNRRVSAHIRRDPRATYILTTPSPNQPIPINCSPSYFAPDPQLSTRMSPKEGGKSEKRVKRGTQARMWSAYHESFSRALQVGVYAVRVREMEVDYEFCGTALKAHWASLLLIASLQYHHPPSTYHPSCLPTH